MGDPVTPRDEWDILQWSGVPYDDARKGFGFKASPRAAATLRKRLAVARRASFWPLRGGQAKRLPWFQIRVASIGANQ